MRQQETETPAVDSRLTWLYRLGGVAALMLGIELLLGTFSLITAVLPSAPTQGAFSTFQDNWLIIIFKMHAGFSGIQIGLLHVLSSLDIAILALAGVTMVALSVALRGTSRFWSLIAAIQPFLGIVLFVATNNAGRSAVMGAALIISLVMLRSGAFSKAIAYTGIATSVLLLIGDFTAGSAPSGMMATIFGMAYLLFTTWLFLAARRLLQFGNAASLAGFQ